MVVFYIPGLLEFSVPDCNSVSIYLWVGSRRINKWHPKPNLRTCVHCASAVDIVQICRHDTQKFHIHLHLLESVFQKEISKRSHKIFGTFKMAILSLFSVKLWKICASSTVAAKVVISVTKRQETQKYWIIPKTEPILGFMDNFLLL